MNASWQYFPQPSLPPGWSWLPGWVAPWNHHRLRPLPGVPNKKRPAWLLAFVTKLTVKIQLLSRVVLCKSPLKHYGEFRPPIRS